MSLTIAIVGRANVGKSTLFNKLVGRKLALVHDTPGVTRDSNEALATLGRHEVRLVDTAGIEPADKGSLTERMARQTEAAIGGADVCLFVIDGRKGLTPGDEAIARALRKCGKPVVVVVNKCEGRGPHPGVAEAWALGFGEPIEVSAEHRLGFEEIHEALDAFAGGEPSAPEEAANKPLRLAIVGRPNVGKSSLFNRLLGSERALTGPEAGITRDAVAARWQIGGREVMLHDTAGLRKRSRAAGQELEQMSVASTLEAIRFADCVLIVIDAAAPFEKQDLTVADMIVKEGRAVVFVVNKFDLVAEPRNTIAKLREELDRMLPQIAGAPLVALSAKTGEGTGRLESAILTADTAWNTRVPTAALNRFLESALARHAPPAVHGRRIRIRYVTQPKSRPPTFALFGNQLKALPDAYLRYLLNGLRDAFELQGTPLRLLLRTAKNPYADDK